MENFFQNHWLAKLTVSIEILPTNIVFVSILTHKVNEV